MSYALKYFRDARVVAWYRAHGVNNKPEGYVVGRHCYLTQMGAQRDADYINSLGPSVPVTVVGSE